MAQIFTSNFHINEFSVVVDELTEEHPRASQPENTKLPLKPHQLTLLQRCIDLENGVLALKDFPNLADQVNENDTMTTKIGIIGDRVGSGKSFVILALILSNNIVEKEDVIVKSYGYNNVVFRLVNKKKVIPTNLLVIPHNLTAQWLSYMDMYTSAIKYVMINKKTIGEFIDDKIKLDDYDLVIVTSTYYNRFASVYSDKEVKFQRIIYDEVDNLNIAGCRMIDSRFVWMVTASYGNLLYPRGFTRWEPTLNRHIWCANGVANAGYIKNLVLDLYNNVPQKLTKLLIAKNQEEYIQKSNILPEIFKNIVICMTPKSIHILNGIVDRTIIECLNADDIQGAITHVNPTNKGSEENIIDLMIQKYTKIILNLNLKLNYTQEYIFDNEADKQSEVAKIESKIKENETKIQMIKDRINDSNTCCICYDDINNKTITKCCQNSFCFKCINLWLSRKANCPMCKTALVYSDIFSVVDDAGSSGITIEDEEELDETKVNPKFDKHKNLQILLASRKPGSKFLIFSNYDSSFQNLYTILTKLNIKYMHLKGNGNVIKCMIDRYKNGDVDVLLVNSRHYGSGLNLENTSDIVMFHKFDTEIEKQVIGRAHRLGRTMPLNIWYLLHENEATVAVAT